MAKERMNGQFIFAVFMICVKGSVTQNIQINPYTQKLFVGLGNKQVLDCNATVDKQGSPPVLTWTTPEKKNITESNTNSSGTYHSVLTIHSFTAAHSGNYTCTNNGVATNRSSIFLYSVTEHKSESEYNFGNRSATLTCTVSFIQGMPQGTFQEWMKDGKSISQLKDPRFSSYDNGTLFISRPTREDAGPYVARYNVTAEYGSFYDCVVVYRAAPLVLDMVKSKNVMEGDTLDLLCEIKGYPVANVTWFLDGQVIHMNQDRVKMTWSYDTEDAHLSISSVQTSDAGKYKCEAADEDGQKSSKTITVRIKGRLDWLWPVIGIICEAVVLGIVIFACSKIKKSSLEDDPATDRLEGHGSHNREHPKNQ